MRGNPTEAESRLWSKLRQRQVVGFKFRRQRPVAGYIVDFYCNSARLAIELDGGQHTEPQNIEYDRARSQRLYELGVRELRFSNIDVLRNTDAVVEAIYRALIEDPHPNPPPEYQGREVE